MQVSLFCSWMSLVVGRFLQLLVFLIIFLSTSVVLYFFWWKYLDKEVTFEYDEQTDENKLLEKSISESDISLKDD